VLVGVEGIGRAPATERVVERVDAEAGVKRVRQPRGEQVMSLASGIEQLNQFMANLFKTPNGPIPAKSPMPWLLSSTRSRASVPRGSLSTGSQGTMRTPNDAHKQVQKAC
jgi:hypothetical protein